MRPQEFDQVALTAVRSWKYQPARSNDEPIQQCGWAVNLRFDLGTPQGAKPAFIASWKTIIALIDAGHLSEASSQIDAITPWNNYEYARLMLLQAYLARAQHDARAELRALTHAVDWSEKLEPELLTNSLRRSFILNLQLGQLAAAETYFKQLRDKYAQSWTEAERRAGEHLVELIDGGSTLATPGLISRRARRDNGAAQWSTRLLRPSFAIDAPGGGVKRIEVQCQNRWYAAEFSASQVWKIPASWGECSLIVFGDEGAALKLIEYAKD